MTGTRVVPHPGGPMAVAGTMTVLPCPPSRTGPEPRCPRCGGALANGPVRFWCPRCRHEVQAADVDVEFRSAASPATARAAAPAGGAR